VKRLDLELSLGVQEETFLSEGGVADDVGGLLEWYLYAGTTILLLL